MTETLPAVAITPSRRRFLGATASAFAALAASGCMTRGGASAAARPAPGGFAGYGALRPDPAGLIDLPGTVYHALQWNVMGSIIGGLVFGYGMALAGNCGFGALVRFGGGDMRSLVVVVVMGIFGFIALSGVIFMAPSTASAAAFTAATSRE